MTADPFSDILRLADAQSVVSGGFRAGGRWAIRFPPFDKLKFSVLVKGDCWLFLDREKGNHLAPLRLGTGDVVLLSTARGFVLASDADAIPIDAAVVFGTQETGLAQVGDGDDCVQIGGFIRLDPNGGSFLTTVLPPVVHVPCGSPHSEALQSLLALLVREQAEALPGTGPVSSQLAQLIFVHALRAHMHQGGSATPGWLRALADPRLAAALRVMHAQPGRAWRLEDLAKAAAMSRTSFAQRFREAAGVAPLTYLTEWRMRLAQKALRDDGARVAEVSESLGYTSVSAFTNAFRRVTGVSPRSYREADRAGRTGV